MKRLSEGFYPGFIVSVIIMILMAIPGNYFPTVVTFWEWLSPDKIIHLFLFGFFSFSILWGYRKEYSEKNNNFRTVIIILSLVLSILYGGLTEFLQKHVFIGRYGSVFDFLADAFGSIIGVSVFVFFSKKN